jgi:hypothetical protein
MSQKVIEVNLIKLLLLQILINTKSAIKSLTFNPFRNALYWTNSKPNGAVSLYSAESSTNFSSRPFLISSSSSQHMEHNLCNCSRVVPTGEPITFDPTTRTILFLSQGGSIWGADESGCDCRQVVGNDVTTKSPHRHALFALGADFSHVYWSGGSGYVAASQKQGGGGGEVIDLLSSGVRELRSFGPSAQPFPDSECLIPKKMEPEEPLLFNHSSHSLHLNLPSGLSSNCSEQV